MARAAVHRKNGVTHLRERVAARMASGGCNSPGPQPKNENGRGRFMNEVVQLITTLISNVGFPIACVCYLFYSQQKEREAHAIESKAWVDALDRNTQVMERLEGKLSTIKEG